MIYWIQTFFVAQNVIALNELYLPVVFGKSNDFFFFLLFSTRYRSTCPECKIHFCHFQCNSNRSFVFWTKKNSIRLNSCEQIMKSNMMQSRRKNVNLEWERFRIWIPKNSQFFFFQYIYVLPKFSLNQQYFVLHRPIDWFHGYNEWYWVLGLGRKRKFERSRIENLGSNRMEENYEEFIKGMKWVTKATKKLWNEKRKQT